MNMHHIIGRLGRDPELKSLNNGNSVCNFSVATTERYNDSDGNKQEKTEWHNIVIYGKTAEVAAKYLHKGDQVSLVGQVCTRSWDDQETGKKNYRTETVLSGFNGKLEFIGGGSNSGNNSGGSSAGSSSSSSMPDGYENIPPADDDLPF